MVYDLVDQGIGVVWSTAYLDEAERCAEVLLLNAGQAALRRPAAGAHRPASTGRTFLVQGAGARRRKLLTAALELPEVIDGVIQGSSVRLVVRRGATPPDAASSGPPVPTSRSSPSPPRFEDAFVDLLGGGPKRESPLAGPAHLGASGGTGTVVEARS